MGKFLHILFFSFCMIIVSQGTMSAQSMNSGLPASDMVTEDLKVYPNPTTDYFQISNSVNIKKVVVFNMFGKEVKTFFHYSNAHHEVSDLKSGMYIVKLLDERNKVVKSIKLHKNFSGV